MSGKANEMLLQSLGDIDEAYVLEYVDAACKSQRSSRRGIRFAVLLAAVIALLGTAITAAAFSPTVGHFLSSLMNGWQAAMQNFDAIQTEYGVQLDDTQACNGMIGTLNSAILEDHNLVLSYTFNWSGMEGTEGDAFHTWYLPWYFQVTQGERVICSSEYTQGLHTQGYMEGDEGEITQMTVLYSLDLGDTAGQDLLGKELTVQLLYTEGGEGFSSTFIPKNCFTDRSWRIDQTYTFAENTILLQEVRESALYVTLFIDCETIGHSADPYMFVLSDEDGNDYTVYPNEDNDKNGYWFVKPEHMGSKLILKIVQNQIKTDESNEIVDDSYAVLYEIPISLETSLFDRISEWFYNS